VLQILKSLPQATYIFGKNERERSEALQTHNVKECWRLDLLPEPNSSVAGGFHSSLTGQDATGNLSQSLKKDLGLSKTKGDKTSQCQSKENKALRPPTPLPSLSEESTHPRQVIFYPISFTCSQNASLVFC
jgi:hypothetical protein